MALKLTAILLILLFGVMQFAGIDTDTSPFAETPGAAPTDVLLAVAPIDVEDDRQPPAPATNPQVTRTPVEATILPASTETGSTPTDTDAASAIDTQSALDLVVIDPNAARNALGLTPSDGTPLAREARLPSATTTDAAPAGHRAEVTGNSVNLRAGPSTGNSVLGRAREGDVVEWVSEPAPGWALIRHPDINGDVYMSSNFLRRLAN